MLTAADIDRLAEKYHAGRYDKQGYPQLDHARAVWSIANAWGAPQTQCMAAVLHDVIEDTDATRDSLTTDGVPADVIDLVVTLTRREGEPYEDYIQRVAQSPEATTVKVCDIWANLARLPTLRDEGEQKRLMAKYTQALRTLAVPLERFMEPDGEDESGR